MRVTQGLPAKAKVPEGKVRLQVPLCCPPADPDLSVLQLPAGLL